jgi:hypothetical protein
LTVRSGFELVPAAPAAAADAACDGGAVTTAPVSAFEGVVFSLVPAGVPEDDDDVAWARLRHAASELDEYPPSEADDDEAVFLILCVLAVVPTACAALGAGFPLERLEAESVEYEALEYPLLDDEEVLEDAARRGGGPTGAELELVGGGGAADAAAFVGAGRRDEADDAYDAELREELVESEL